MVERVCRKFGGLIVDTSDWPILLMEFPGQRFPDVDLHHALGYIEQLMRESEESGEKSFQVTDLTLMKELAPASQRRYSAEWVKRTTPLLNTTSLGGANVTPSTLLRGLITAIYWFQSSEATTPVIVATRKEAYREALRSLEAAGVPLPPGMRARIAEAH